MKRSLRYLFLVVIFSLAFRTPATACSPVAWDFAKHFSVSNAVVHGRILNADLQLKFKMDGEYVVFLGDVPPNLRFANEFRTALMVDKNGHVQDMGNHTNSVKDLLDEFASYRGYSVLRPDAHAPHWSSTARVRTWALVAAGVVSACDLRQLLLTTHKSNSSRPRNHF